MKPAEEELAEDRDEWYRLAAQALARAYGQDEPAYTDADLIEEPATDRSCS